MTRYLATLGRAPVYSAVSVQSDSSRYRRTMQRSRNTAINVALAWRCVVPSNFSSPQPLPVFYPVFPVPTRHAPADSNLIISSPSRYTSFPRQKNCRSIAIRPKTLLTLQLWPEFTSYS